jgi:hypothetical protein
MICRPVAAAGSVSTPDLFSALLLLASFYGLIEKKSTGWICFFLLLAVFTRIDNIVPAFFIMLLLAASPERQKRFSLKKSVIFLLVLSAAYLAVAYPVVRYKWSIWYYPTFISHLDPAYDQDGAFSLTNYLAVAGNQLKNSLRGSSLFLFLTLGLIFLINSEKPFFRRPSFDQLVLLAIFAIILTRFLLQPVIADRFYIAYYIVILVLLIKRITERLSRVRMT